MSEHIKVYFISENDAESAKAKLQTLKTKNIFIEKIDENIGLNFLVPLASVDTTTVSTGTVNGLSSMVPLIPVEETAHDKTKHGTISHLLTADVAREDEKKAINMLSSLDCYQSKE